jgi:hypothetical protein
MKDVHTPVPALRCTIFRENDSKPQDGIRIVGHLGAKEFLCFVVRQRALAKNAGLKLPLKQSAEPGTSPPSLSRIGGDIFCHGHKNPTRT